MVRLVGVGSHEGANPPYLTSFDDLTFHHLKGSISSSKPNRVHDLSLKGGSLMSRTDKDVSWSVLRRFSEERGLMKPAPYSRPAGWRILSQKLILAEVSEESLVNFLTDLAVSFEPVPRPLTESLWPSLKLAPEEGVRVKSVEPDGEGGFHVFLDLFRWVWFDEVPPVPDYRKAAQVISNGRIPASDSEWDRAEVNTRKRQHRNESRTACRNLVKGFNSGEDAEPYADRLPSVIGVRKSSGSWGKFGWHYV